MNKKTFFAKAASKALALAATVMMSAAFTACSSSNNDDDGGGGTPPTPKAQTVTFDGAEKPILEAGYQYWGDGNYVLFFSLSASSQERVRLGLNKELHATGNPINLTEKEKNRKRYDDRFRWGVTYLNAHGNLLFYANGTEPVFETGTLTMSGSPDGTINIRLENGRVKGEDGKEYTFTLSYSGTMERAGGPTPVEKYVDLGLPSGLKWARCNLGASKRPTTATTTHGARQSPTRPSTTGVPTSGCRPARTTGDTSPSTPSPTTRPRASGMTPTATSSATTRRPSKRPTTPPPPTSARPGACRPGTKSKNCSTTAPIPRPRKTA